MLKKKRKERKRKKNKLTREIWDVVAVKLLNIFESAPQ